MLRENMLKKLIRNGGKALGCWTSMENPISTEILASCGFDFLIIDHEHGYGDAKGLSLQLQAMASTDSCSMLRVPEINPSYFKRVLDTGIEAIMVPGINSAAEAELAIRSIMYPPQGSRGLAPGMIRASRYGLNAAEYVREVNNNLFIVCQIETSEAVENIESIATVSGVDMLFIGPNDLSASLGKFSQYDDPEVRSLLELAEQRILATGKPLGSIPYGNHSWQDMFDRGCSLTTAGTEVSLLRTAAVDIISKHSKNNRDIRAAE